MLAKEIRDGKETQYISATEISATEPIAEIDSTGLLETSYISDGAAFLKCRPGAVCRTLLRDGAGRVRLQVPDSPESRASLRSPAARRRDGGESARVAGSVHVARCGKCGGRSFPKGKYRQCGA